MWYVLLPGAIKQASTARFGKCTGSLKNFTQDTKLLTSTFTELLAFKVEKILCNGEM